MTRNNGRGSLLRVDRRRWLAGSIGALVAPCGVHLEGPVYASRSALERLRVGAIGVGNRGNDNLADVPVDETAALCDVDQRYLEEARRLRPAARCYRDFREMFDRESLDAVIISAPDHIHASAVLWALRKGIHTYCERPLARTVGQIHSILREVTRCSVVTQMGNQHHRAAGYQRAAEALRRGVLGQVHAIHAWTVRPLWPQGLERPQEQPPVPDYLDWDLWLGPAPERPYHPAYHPMRWRAWWDFGTGTLGDMAIHLLDPVMVGLELAEPRTISAEVSGRHRESFPAWSIVRWTVPRRDAPDLVITWYDGGKLPPEDVTQAQRLPPHGVLVLGERGKMFIPELGGPPRFIPAQLGAALANWTPEPTVSHVQNFLQACRGMALPYSDFQYGARLSKFCILANIALFHEGLLTWNADQQVFEDAVSANERLDEPSRPGW
jgi:predicted dehydrogenase